MIKSAYEILLCVLEQGSFLQASSVLHMTPSAISHSIAKLEQDVGCTLLTRSRTGVTLTSSGETLVPLIRDVIKSEAVLRQKAASLQGLTSGVVRIGCFNSICSTFLPGWIKEFNREYPGIDFLLYQGTYADVLEWLKSGVVEIGFLSEESAGSDIFFEPLFKDELLCIVPKGFAVQNASYITQDEIRNQAFVAQRKSVDSDIQNYLQKYQLQVSNSCYVEDDLAAVYLVSSGFGICIIPKLLLTMYSYPVDQYSLMPKGFRTIGISFRRKDELSPAAEKFYERLKELHSSELEI